MGQLNARLMSPPVVAATCLAIDQYVRHLCSWMGRLRSPGHSSSAGGSITASSMRHHKLPFRRVSVHSGWPTPSYSLVTISSFLPL